MVIYSNCRDMFPTVNLNTIPPNIVRKLDFVDILSCISFFFFKFPPVTRSFPLYFFNVSLFCSFFQSFLLTFFHFPSLFLFIFVFLIFTYLHIFIFVSITWSPSAPGITNLVKQLTIMLAANSNSIITFSSP